MGCNRLRLNVDKTQVIWMGTRQQLEKIEIDELILHSSTIQFSTKVVNLGVVLDNQLKMTEQVSSLSRSCFFQLRQIRTIRRSLTSDSTKTLVNAFVNSRLDYCNSLLYGVGEGLDGPAAACAECGGTARIWRQEIRPHHIDNDGFALVADSTASDIQGGHSDLPMSPWSRSRLPRRWLRRCFVDSWSSVFALGGASWNWLYCGQEQGLPVRVPFLCVGRRSGIRCRAHWDRQNFLITVFGRNLKRNCSWKAASVIVHLWGAGVLIVRLLVNFRINK